MTTNLKHEIVNLIEEQREALGSQAHVANRADVSEATISQMRAGNWDKIREKMWRKVGSALGWKTSGWQTVETENTKMLFNNYEMAKNACLWTAVAANAGSGKTQSAQAYLAANRRNSVYLFKAREYKKREFLKELARTLGLNVTTKHHTNQLVRDIAAFFLERADQKPLLIIDEADKLHPESLRTLIPIYNEVSDTLGVVIQGVPNLKRQFANGKKWDKKGFAELMSRFGSKFVELPGLTKDDALAICAANGIKDKSTQLAIWKSLDLEKVMHRGLEVSRARDVRRLERLIKTNLFTFQPAA